MAKKYDLIDDLVEERKKKKGTEDEDLIGNLTREREEKDAYERWKEAQNKVLNKASVISQRRGAVNVWDGQQLTQDQQDRADSLGNLWTREQRNEYWQAAEDKAMRNRNAIGLVDPEIANVYGRMAEEGARIGDPELLERAQAGYKNITESSRKLLEEETRRRQGTAYQPGQVAPTATGSPDDAYRQITKASNDINYYYRMADYAAQMGMEPLYNEAIRKIEELAGSASQDAAIALDQGKSVDYKQQFSNNARGWYNSAAELTELADLYGTPEDFERYKDEKRKAGLKYEQDQPSLYYAQTMSRDEIQGQMDYWQEQVDRLEADYTRLSDRQNEITAMNPEYYEDGRQVTSEEEMRKLQAMRDEEIQSLGSNIEDNRATYRNAYAMLQRYKQAMKVNNGMTARKAAWDVTNDPRFAELVEEGKKKYAQEAEGDWTRVYFAAGDANEAYQDLERNHFEFGLSNKERDVYYALYAKDPKDAHAYAESKYQEHMAENLAEVRTYTDNNPLARAAFTVGGSVTKLVSGLMPFTRAGRDLSEYANLILEGTGESLSEKGLLNTGLLSGEADTFMGKLSLKDATMLTSSIIQSWLIAQTAGAAGATMAGAGASAAEIKSATELAEFLGTALMGSSAANDTFYQKLDQDWDTGAALVEALTAGINEALFEYISVDKLINQDITRGFVRNVVTQGLTEASEELCTTIANTIDESVIAGITGNKTEVENRADELMGQGLDYADAISQARHEWMIGLIQDAVGGFLSGGAMTGGNYAAYGVNKVGQKISNAFWNIYDITRYGEMGLFPQSYRDAEWAEAATGKAAVNAEGLLQGKLSEQTAKIEGGKDAVEAFAKDNKIKVKSETELSEKTVQKVTDKLTEQMAATKDVAKAEQLYQQTIEKYGEGIRPAATQALSRATLRITRKVGGSVQQTLSESRQAVESIRDEKARNAAQAGLDAAVLERTRVTSEQAQRDMGSDYLRSRLQPMTLQATVTQADGSTKQVGIKSITEDNKSVVLEDGSTVKIDELQTDSDTKDVLQAISKSGMGGQYAADMLATYQALKDTGKIADPYRWSMDYIKAYDRGRVGEITMEETASYAKRLDADTVKLAYEAGQKAGQTMKADEKARVAKMLEIADKGATGHKGSVVAANADVERTLATTKDKTVKDFVEKIRRFAEFFGVTVRLTESKTAQREFTDEKGNKVTKEVYEGARGSHEAGVIEIDINSGKNFVGDAANGMLYTMAHEMSHFISTYNPDGFGEIKRFAFRQIVNQTSQEYLDDLIQKQLDDHADDPNFTKPDAEEEVVAEFCQGMLTNKATLETFAKESPKGFKAFAEWVKNFLANIREKLAEMPAATGELAIYQALEDKVKDAFGELWAREVMGAVQVHDAVGSAGNQMAQDGNIHDVTNSKGEVVAVQDGQGHMMEQIRTYEEDGRKKLVTYLNSQVKAGNLTQTEAGQIRQSVEEMYVASKALTEDSKSFKEWSYADVQRDTSGKSIFSWMKSNSEYGWSMDASLVCIKRRTLDAVFDHMIRHNMLDNFDMASQSVVAINDIIRSYGFETACGLCYIDAKRYRAAMIAGGFCDLYNELVRSMVPEGKSLHIDFFNYGQNGNIRDSGRGIDTLDNSELDFTKINEVLHSAGKKTVEYKIAKALKDNPAMRRLTLTGDFMSSTGFTEMGRVNKDLRKLYNAKKGAGGPKATEADTQYLHEIIGSTMEPAKYFALGGLRVQSFSDYIPRLVFDYVEMIGDMAAKKLPSHAYSKELMFALQFGMTGMKINMSLIPAMVENGIAPGLDADGNYAWRDGQSFGSTVYGLNKEQLDFYAQLLGDKVGERLTAEQGFRLAKMIQNAEGYSQNCGTIAIGVSDEQIRKMLDDDDIRMIIPYHKSGLNHILQSMMNVAGFNDYTGVQMTKKKNASGEWVNLPKGTKDFNINEYMYKHGVDAKAAAQAYLDWCEKKGYRPKFDSFKGHENYYKLLVDFNCYDATTGAYAAQQAVQAVFPAHGDSFGDMKGLMKMALQGEDVLQGRQDDTVPKIVDTITRTLPALEAANREAAGITDEQKKTMTTKQFSDKIGNIKEEKATGIYESWKAENRIDEKKYQNRTYSQQRDTEYLEIAKDPEMNEFRLQEMVDEAAKRAGYTIRAQHGSFSEQRFTVFEPGERGEMWFGSPGTAYQRPQMYDTYLKMDNPYEVTYTVGADTKFDPQDVVEKGRQNGHDGGIVHFRLDSEMVKKNLPIIEKLFPDMQATNGFVKSFRFMPQGDLLNTLAKPGETLVEFMKRGMEGDLYQWYTVYKPSQIKSADPVTYDDSGNVIPLSERFRTDRADTEEWKNRDIRYQQRTYDMPADTDLMMAAKAENATSVEQKRLLTEYQSRGRDVAKLEEMIAKLKEERDAWKEKAKHGGKYAKGLIDSKNRDIAKLEKQIQKHRDVMAGKLRTPELARMLRTERENAARQMAQHKDEVMAGQRERRKQSELRNRIKNLADDMKRRMTKPTDNAYVPAALYGSMTKLADVLDQVLSPEKGTKAEGRYRAVMDAIHGLSREYAGIKDIDDYAYSSEFDEEIQNQISELERVLDKDRSWVGELTGDGVSVRELGTKELQQIYDILRQIDQTMKNATKLLANGKLGSLYDAMGKIITQQRGMKSYNSLSWLSKKKRMRQLESLSVMRAVEMMSGWNREAALYQLMHAIENGVDISWAWRMAYNKSLQDLKTGKNEKAYRDALTKKIDYSVTDADGDTVLMTKMQALQLLMTAEREAHNENLIHLQRGGAVIRDALKIQDGKASDATAQTIQVTPELIQRIRDSLTEWDKQYMKAIRNYFALEAKRTNEVHYDLKHRVLQTEDFYVPYIVDKNYLDTKLDGDQAMNMWVKAPGSTNAIVKNASQPVIIDGMDTVMDRHVKEIADYIGLAAPIRDFSKVYNGRVSQGDGSIPLPVKQTIDRTFKEKGQHLLTQSIIDVQGGGSGTSWSTAIGNHLKGLQSAFVRSALLLNPSVTIKQAASYIAAASILSQQALDRANHPISVKTDKSNAFDPATGLIGHLFFAPNGKTATRIYNEIDKYTSLHYQRRLGMSQYEVASEANRSGKLKRAMNDVGARMEQSTIGHAVRKAGEAMNPVTWIQRMDVATTATLWLACKEQARMDGKKVGSEEYWTRTTELYERVIRETQPMYDGLHRNAYQKGHETLMTYLFPFRTVPIQNHGQIVASYETLRAAMESGDKARIKEAKKFFAKTMVAQTQSAIIFSLMTFLAAALKRKTKRYRDDDEELDMLSVINGIGLDTGKTMFSNFFPLLGSAIWDSAGNIYDSVKTGKKIWSYDSFSVGPVDLLNEFAKAGEGLITDTANLIAGKDVSWDTVSGHMKDALVKSLKCLGIPASTIKTYVEGLIGNINDIAEGRIPALNDESWERSESLNAERYFKAWEAGDTQKVDAVEKEMLRNYTEAGKSEEEAAQALKTKLTSTAKDAFENGTLEEQDAIDFLTETGFYSADEAWKKVMEWDNRAEHEGEEDYSYSQYEDFFDSLDAGLSLDEAGKDYTAHGFTQKQLVSAAVSHVKERYQSGEIGEEKAMELLQAYKEDMDADKAWFKVREWDAKAEHAEDEDYSYRQYENIDAAIDANKDISGLVKELTDHGVAEKDVASHVKSYLIDRYAKGNVTEAAFKNQLSRYLGIVAKDDVDKIMRDANCKRQFGVSYTGLDEEYRAGKVSKADIRNAMIKYGGMTGADADKKIRWYDLQKSHPDLDITEANANNWYDGTTKSQENGHQSAKAAGMSIEAYIKAKATLSKISDTNGNGTGEDEYIAALSKMTGLTARQKDALYYEKYKGTTKYSRKTW